MAYEFFTLILFSVVAAGLCALGRRNQSIIRRRGAMLFAALWTVATAVLIGAAFSNSEPTYVKEPPSNYPIEENKDGYVTSRSCKSCHPHQHATWHASYHRTMTQLASPETVVGDFDNVELELAGKKYKLWREEDRYWVDFEMPNWTDKSQPARRVKRELVMTTGSHHQQVYWFPSVGHGRILGLMPFVYLREEQRWTPFEAIFLHPGSEPTGRFDLGRWNRTCLRCHSTHPRPGMVAADQMTMDTRVAEFGISCEACHGPGEEHIRVNRDPLQRYKKHFADVADKTIKNPARLSNVRSSQVCGQCHGVGYLHSVKDEIEFAAHGFSFRPGDDLNQSRNVICNAHLDRPTTKKKLKDDPQLWDETFWSDGMVRVSGREYNGLIETPCYQQGEMSCLSCHVMHVDRDDPRPMKEWANDQLQSNMQGNHACIQCHEEYKDDDTLLAHTHHSLTSSGSSCYNCHMPHTSYGLLKAIRSHQIDTPSVSTSLKTGRPNACNLCHLDKTLDWTAGHLADWYKIPKPKLTEDEQNIAASILWAMRGDAGQRALLAWHMGWQPAREVSGTDWLAPYLAVLMTDPYMVVRFISHRSLTRDSEFNELRYDYIRPPAERDVAAKRVIAAWTKAERAALTRRMDRSAILLDADGRLKTDEIDRLLESQNKRPLTLAE